MNSNSFIRVQVRVQKKYFFEFKFEFGKMIEFFRVRVHSLALLEAWNMQHLEDFYANKKPIKALQLALALNLNPVKYFK